MLHMATQQPARVKAIVLIGEASEKIRKSLSGIVPMENASGMKEAVKLSYSIAFPEGVVLLAPGCTSFDMFKSFEDRGRVFKKEVRALEENVKKGRAQ